MKNFEKIQKLLLSTKTAAGDDESTFLQWERGEISTASCIKRFRVHNMVDNSIDISQIEFETWLSSLGYRRRGYGEEQSLGPDKGADPERV